MTRPLLYLLAAFLFCFLLTPAFSADRAVNVPYSINDGNELSFSIDGYYESCMDRAVISRHINGEWVRVEDSLPGKGNYYIDGKFVGYGMCDYIVCTTIPAPFTVSLVERKRVGEQAPPPDSGTTVPAVPVFTTVPLSGGIRVEMSYYGDQDCQDRKDISIVVER